MFAPLSCYWQPPYPRNKYNINGKDCRLNQYFSHICLHLHLHHKNGVRNIAPRSKSFPPHNAMIICFESGCVIKHIIYSARKKKTSWLSLHTGIRASGSHASILGRTLSLFLISGLIVSYCGCFFCFTLPLLILVLFIRQRRSCRGTSRPIKTDYSTIVSRHPYNPCR